MRMKGQFTPAIIKHCWGWGSYLRHNGHWSKPDEKVFMFLTEKMKHVYQKKDDLILNLKQWKTV